MKTILFAPTTMNRVEIAKALSHAFTPVFMSYGGLSASDRRRRVLHPQADTTPDPGAPTWNRKLKLLSEHGCCRQ